MLVNLKIIAEQDAQQSQDIEISGRLPGHLHSPCVVHCLFQAKAYKDYYLLTLRSDAALTITCQRCLTEFSHQYSNTTELAICDSDETAERMMNHYDCIVSDYRIDLGEIITDELYLYSPEFHLDIDQCNDEIAKYINQ
ncbi:MAG: DUF177 domain-containing protein [Tatlockia sp.]|nr:DUF177 domain-containing protein [Tatlockia sp.]